MFHFAEDGRLMADAESGEFWGFFGGFAPLPRKTANDEDKTYNSDITKLFWLHHLLVVIIHII